MSLSDGSVFILIVLETLVVLLDPMVFAVAGDVTPETLLLFCLFCTFVASVSDFCRFGANVFIFGLLFDAFVFLAIPCWFTCFG